VACIPVRRDELLSALNAGRGDIAAASLSITPGREEIVAFSDPWTSDVREVVVTGPESPELRSIEDLAGQDVYVRPSSSYYDSLEVLNARFKAQGLPPVHVHSVDESLESEDIMEMVGAGLLPLTVVDRYRARLWSEVLPDIRVRDDLEVAQGQRLAWAVRKDNPQLQGLINEFVKSYRSSKDRAFLERKYFVKSGYLRNANASEDLRRFEAAVKYFRSYGRQYDLDFLLLAAQGYQESRLDQDALSPAGAVGVMQLLPSTAAGAPIYLPNIRYLGTNIHAGAKYYRYLIDRYFNDPAISPQNRLLFAFAGYNAGPGNMARMRRLARDMGLDPNQWARRRSATSATSTSTILPTGW
jgi:membrane-bound lytic murein transglycosylase MltF